MPRIDEWEKSASSNRRAIETRHDVNPIDFRVGYRIRQRRIAAGMNEQELATAIGVGVARIQSYEKGEKRVGARLLYEISMVLECIPTFFFEN